jgi:hypothetical protein
MSIFFCVYQQFLYKIMNCSIDIGKDWLYNIYTLIKQEDKYEQKSCKFSISNAINFK